MARKPVASVSNTDNTRERIARAKVTLLPRSAGNPMMTPPKPKMLHQNPKSKIKKEKEPRKPTKALKLASALSNIVDDDDKSVSSDGE